MEEFKHFNLDKPQSVGQDWVSSPNITRTDKNVVVKDYFEVNDQEVSMLRGQRISRRAVDVSTTLSTNDLLVGVTSLVVAPTIGLPNPVQVGIGKTYFVKDEVGGAATTTITIRSEGEKNIDGAATSTLTTNYQSRSYYSDGSNWFTF